MPTRENKAARRKDRHGGFTLIEMIAAIAIMALLLGVVISRVGSDRDTLARREAEALADRVSFARQRAVVTGRTHRVILDFEASTHWVEWRPPLEEAELEAPGREIDLSPPAAPESGEFVPVSAAGADRKHATQRGVWLLEIDAADARRDGDLYALHCEPEGGGDSARIIIGDDDGEYRWAVEIHAFSEDIAVIPDDA